MILNTANTPGCSCRCTCSGARVVRLRARVKQTETPYDSTSVALLLDTARSEYANEHTRSTTLDSKAGIALPILATSFLALAQMNNYRALVTFPIEHFSAMILPGILALSYTAALVFSLLSVIWMARVMLARAYTMVDPEGLYSNQWLQNSSIALSIHMMTLYFDAIQQNRDTNNTRVKLYQKSWFFAFAAVGCYVVYVLICNNI